MAVVLKNRVATKFSTSTWGRVSGLSPIFLPRAKDQSVRGKAIPVNDITRKAVPQFLMSRGSVNVSLSTNFVEVHKIRPFWSLIQCMAYPGRFAIQFLYNQGWTTGVRLHRPTALYRLLDYSPEKIAFSIPPCLYAACVFPNTDACVFWRRAVMRSFPSSKPPGESRNVPCKAILKHAIGRT